MILYSYYRSSCSYRARIALNYYDINYELRPIHLVANGGEQHHPDFKSINPQAEVPVLSHDDTLITQSLAIINYLEDRYASTERRLFPLEPNKKAKCIELCEIINAGTQPLQNLRVLQYLQENFAIGDDQKTAWVQHWIERGLSSFQQKLPPSPQTQTQTQNAKYCLGNSLSACDLFLIPQLYNARRYQVDMSQFQRLCEIETHCLQLPCFFQASPEQCLPQA